MMAFDCYIQEVTTNGHVVSEWRVWEHPDPVDGGIPWSMDIRSQWTTCNGIAEWPNGDITLSFRNISKVITLSRQTGQIVWKLGLPLLSGQLEAFSGNRAAAYARLQSTLPMLREHAAAGSLAAALGLAA